SHTKSHTMDFSMNVADASDKDDAGWFFGLPGQRNVSGSSEGNIVYNADGSSEINIENLFSDGIVSRSSFAHKWTTGVTGGFYFSGAGYINSLSLSYPNEETSTFSCGH